MGGPRASDARMQRGLILLAIGERDSAGLAFAGATGEAAQFWRGVVLRSNPSARARGDSLLMALARKPGYAFYRTCARETLGVQGWPGDVVEAAGDSSAAVLLRARRLLAADPTGEDAMTLLSRWAAADARLDGSRPGIAEWLAAARMAFGCGRVALGTLWVDRALLAAQSRADSIQWALVPWAYPPAFEPFVRAAAVDSLAMDAPLLWGLMRQESRFDPRARSRSNALGLTQLKVEAASDAARMLRESAPNEATLFDPAHAVRYGAAYLGALLRRFDRRVPVALAAYNAGPSAVRKDWRELIARGGEALYCEVASNADSQDYVKRITGFRAAYRELAPAER
jgi:soluble lytic murein transglycosylase-like protein